MSNISTFIPLSKPNINDKDIGKVAEVLKSGMLVQGKYVEGLESAFSLFTRSGYASALSNGTATLHLALIALGIKKGDEVIIPAFSYIATANVIELVGAKPIFVDIDIKTFNIDTTKIENAITTKTKAIMPVHEFGLACEMDNIMKIAKKHNLFVIEDAACALGALYKKKPVGSFGDFGSFSLHPRKAISSGEGGVLISNSKKNDKQIKILRNHGCEIINGKMDFSLFGYNYRMTDFQAALVLSQMDRLGKSIDNKNQLANIYLEKVQSKKIKLPVVPENCNHTWQTFHTILDDTIDRDKLIKQLYKLNIGTNYGAQCIPYMQSFQNKYRLNCKKLYPNSLRAFKQGLVLPMFDLASEDQINKVSKTINQLLK